MLRCSQCRTRRTTFEAMLKHEQQAQHKYCTCGGYHYKHRPGSRMCEQHPFSSLYRQMREQDMTQDQILDIQADIAWSTPGKPGQQCPF